MTNCHLRRLGPAHPAYLKDVIVFNEQQPGSSRVVDQELFLKAQDKGPLTDPAYSRRSPRINGFPR
jgi:hypothetical protein